MEPRRGDWWFASEAGSVSAARMVVAQMLQGGVPGGSLDVVLVLTSELVTNAVRHATGPVGVHLTWDHRGVLLEVEDESPELPIIQTIESDAAHGRGLLIVEALSGGWGVKRTETGKTVWFTVAT